MWSTFNQQSESRKLTGIAYVWKTNLAEVKRKSMTRRESKLLTTLPKTWNLDFGLRNFIKQRFLEQYKRIKIEACYVEYKSGCLQDLKLHFRLQLLDSTRQESGDFDSIGRYKAKEWHEFCLDSLNSIPYTSRWSVVIEPIMEGDHLLMDEVKLTKNWLQFKFVKGFWIRITCRYLSTRKSQELPVMNETDAMKKTSTLMPLFWQGKKSGVDNVVTSVFEAWIDTALARVCDLKENIVIASIISICLLLNCPNDAKMPTCIL